MRDALYAFLFSVIAGLAAALYIIGPGALNPRNIAWLHRDPAAEYLGWALFRDTSTWFLPLTWTDRLGYPWGVSISFFDSIPLVAVLLRPFSPVLGEPFQYHGLYGAASLILQALFGLVLARRLGLSSFFSAALGAVFFMLAPALLARFYYGHFTLTGQWLVLAGLACYLRDIPAGPRWRWLLPFWGVLALAGAINPYLALMCLLIALAAVGRLWLERRVGLRDTVADVVITAAVLAGSLAAAGFLIGGRVDGYSAGGYRDFSLNLLAPFDPMASGGLFAGSLPRATIGQSEGYAYLGAGLIGLLALGLLTRSIRISALFTARLLPLVALAVVSTCLAASATVTLGAITLLHLPLPEPFERAAGMFRASGRLFWPAYYLLVLAALASVRGLRPPVREGVLMLALAVQIIDVIPLAHKVREVTDHRSEIVLANPVWNTLSERHSHLTVHPAWQCGSEASPGGYEGFAIFGFLASRLGMTINSYQSGRLTPREFERHCQEAQVAFLGGSLDPAAAYVVSDDLMRGLDPARITAHRCSRVDGFNLCVHDPDAPGPDPAISYATSDVSRIILEMKGGTLTYKASLLLNDLLEAEELPYGDSVLRSAIHTLDMLGYLRPDQEGLPDLRSRQVGNDSTLATGACGHVDAVAQTQAGYQQLVGWAVLPWRNAPADVVVISHRGPANHAEIVALVRTRHPRPDVAQVFARAEYTTSGWRIVLPSTRLSEPGARLQAWAFDTVTGRTCPLHGP
ncbi:MAG: hypothetical protein H0X67_01195 [Acidobacteria bacterium]|nr:hypothetical protein [Acidobacteriota bacterium]